MVTLGRYLDDDAALSYDTAVYLNRTVVLCQSAHEERLFREQICPVQQLTGCEPFHNCEQCHRLE